MDYVEGAELLVERFGEWPSFHDSEVQGVTLDSGQRALAPPSITVEIHVFRTLPETDEAGRFATDLHSLVSFRFDDVSGVELRHFGSQNVLWDLEISPSEGGELSVELPSSFNLAGGFNCARAMIASVEHFEPGPRSPYHRP